jgi:hypothetical protein
MKRREFVTNSATALGLAMTGSAAHALSPCNPPTLTIDGNATFSAACDDQGSSSAPAWLAGRSLFEWTAVPNSLLKNVQSDFTSPGGSKEYVMSYSGGAVKAAGSELFVIGGGHADYAGNEIYSIMLSANAPQWKRRNMPTASVGSVSAVGSSHYSDGRPSSRHTYWTAQFINSKNRLMTFGAAAVWGNGNGNFDTVDGFNPTTNDYDPAGTYPSQSGIGIVSAGVAVDAAENVYVHNHATGVLYRWNCAANNWTNLGNKGVYNYETAMACDTTRNRILRVRNGGIPEAVIDLSGGLVLSTVGFLGSLAGSISGGSLVYDKFADCFWFWKRGSSSLYRIHPVTWAVSVQSVSGSVPDNTYVDGRHMIYGRFGFVPELRGLVFVKDVDSSVYFIRTS